MALRIRSFQYTKGPFAHLDEEIQSFWKSYWGQKAPHIKTLIIDVINNWGGESPVPYYAMLYNKPFQEQYVQFKKIQEFERSDILDSLFWGDPGKEIWFKALKADGTLEGTATGNFLSPIPQFCADPEKDCREGLFSSQKSGFKGHVRLLMNHWCISSCVGFVYNLKGLLGDRVRTYGIPDSGDSAFSRLTILVNPATQGGADTQVAALKKAKTPDQPEAWVRQVISATRSTDQSGQLLSGLPQKIDVWVPRTWQQSDDDWATAVFDTAAKN